MDYTILDFCVNLARQMIFCGANLERVERALLRLGQAYGLVDVSFLLQSDFLSMGAWTKDGVYLSRQTAIPPYQIHLGKLRDLNRLCTRVIEETPPVSELQGLLEQSLSLNGYPGWLISLAQIGALGCVCMMFGGGVPEVLGVAFIVVILQQLQRLFSRTGIDQVVVNALMMFVGCFAAYFLDTDFGMDIPTVLITLCIMLIPGITLVNAVRNLLCGHEMNGTLQLMKTVIETLSMAFGIFMAFLLFGIEMEAHEALVTGPSWPFLLIVLSFLVSFFNAVCFQIAPRDLLLAGVGGALSRIALLVFTSQISNPMLYSMLAALIAAFYAEVIASYRQDPSTYFVYPAILPMIPGGSFYYAMIALFAGNTQMFAQQGTECALTLIGMSIGFVLSSFVSHYARKMHHAHFDPDRPVPPSSKDPERLGR